MMAKPRPISADEDAVPLLLGVHMAKGQEDQAEQLGEFLGHRRAQERLPDRMWQAGWQGGHEGRRGKSEEAGQCRDKAGSRRGHHRARRDGVAPDRKHYNADRQRRPESRCEGQNSDGEFRMRDHHRP